MASYIDEACQASFSDVYLLKKANKYLKKFTKEIAGIMPQPGLWWQKLTGTDSSGLLLWQMQNDWCETVTGAKDMPGKLTCRLRS